MLAEESEYGLSVFYLGQEGKTVGEVVVPRPITVAELAVSIVHRMQCGHQVRVPVVKESEAWQAQIVQRDDMAYCPAACLCHPSVRLMPAEAGREL
jgi:hypothetical protein